MVSHPGRGKKSSARYFAQECNIRKVALSVLGSVMWSLGPSIWF